MKFDEFAHNIVSAYSKRFPGGYCRVAKYVCFGKSITIDMYLSSKETGKSTSVMGDNDMFKICLNVSLPDKFNYESDELPEKVTMESWSNHYLVKPELPYMAYSSRKVPYRKTTGAAEKLIATAEKFMDRLHDMIVEDLAAGNVHENFIRIAQENILKI